MNLPLSDISTNPNSRHQPGYGGNGSVRPGNSVYSRIAYPGLDQVLETMKKLVLEFKGHPKIRSKAVAITAGIPRDIRTALPDRRNYHNIAEAVYAWMKKNIEYVRDPDGIEWLQTPLITLEQGYGDCDDQATLAGAMLSSIGVPVRFKVVKADPGKPDAYSHVYLEYKAGGKWKPFDPTLHTKAGDGLNDSQVFGSRTVDLSDSEGECGCGCGGSCGAVKKIIVVGAGIGALLGIRYLKQKNII